MMEILMSLIVSSIPVMGGSAAYISDHPTDRLVTVGGSVTLCCAVQGYDGTVQWTKDGLALGSDHRLPGWPRYSVVGFPSLGEHNLRVVGAELGDEAVYECQATEVALRSQRARLTVLVPPDPPVIGDGPVIRVKADTPYNLTCRVAKAKPAPDINWYRDGVLRPSALYSKRFTEDGKTETATSVLPIIPVETDSGHTYTCRAANEAIPTGKETSATLSVQHLPAVTLSVHPTPVLEGAMVKFTCSASANPEVLTYRWAKAGELIEGQTGEVFEAAVDHTFYTEPVSCEATNSVGKTNVSSILDIHFGPILISEPEDQEVDVGSDVLFTSVWIGNPSFTLTWAKLRSNLVLSNGDTLRLKSVTQSDSGVYVCKAIVPRVGAAEHSVTLTVNGLPIIIAEPFQETVQGEIGHIQCFVGSLPPPEKIVWSWTDNVMESGTYGRFAVDTVAVETGVISTLSIAAVTDTDIGLRYNCTAWNRFGFSTSVIGLRERDSVPLGVILGVTVGAAIAGIIALVILVSIFCRSSRRAEKGVRLSKSDIRVQIVPNAQISPKHREENISPSAGARSESPGTCRTETSEMFEEDEDCLKMKDPTNGYYNVRLGEDRGVSGRSGFLEYVPRPRMGFEGSTPSPHELSLGFSSLRHPLTLAKPHYPPREPLERGYALDPIYSPTAFVAPPFTRGFVSQSGFEPLESWEDNSVASSQLCYPSASAHLLDFSHVTQQRMQTHV